MTETAVATMEKPAETMLTLSVTAKERDLIVTALNQQVAYTLRKVEQFGGEAGEFFRKDAENQKGLISRMGGTYKERGRRERN